MTCICKIFGTHNCTIQTDTHECICLDSERQRQCDQCKASSHSETDKCICLSNPDTCKLRSTTLLHDCTCRTLYKCFSDDHQCICHLFFSDDINDCYFTQDKSCESSLHDCTCKYLKGECKGLNHQCICCNGNGVKCLSTSHDCKCERGFCKASVHVCKCLELGPYICKNTTLQTHECICHLSLSFRDICRGRVHVILRDYYD